MPETSVIIPVYNGAAHIVDAVTSVLNQTQADREIIVVDDGSRDNTRAILEPLAAAGKVRYLYQENGGPARARNTGIRAARGRYIAFLDSDDLWARDKLEQQLRLMHLYGLKAAHCGLAVSRDGAVLDDELEPEKFRGGWLFEDCMLLKSWVFLSCLVVHASVLEDIGLFNELLPTAEDTNLVLRIARRYRFGFVDRQLVTRRLHGGNMTTSGGHEMGTFKNLEDIARRYPELHPSRSALMRKAYRARYLMLGCTVFRSGNYVASRPFLSNAWRLNPLDPKGTLYLAASFVPRGPLSFLRKGKSSFAALVRGRRGSAP